MDFVERLLAFVLQNRKGHDAGLIPKSKPFKNVPEPTIQLECPDIGPSGSKIPSKYGFFEAGSFPTLKWNWSQSSEGQEPAKEVKEWFLAVEDPDAPLAEPVPHGLYYSIPASKTSVTSKDFEQIGNSSTTTSSNNEYTLKGGFKYGLNRRKTIYIAPRGLLGHGPHRYFYEIVALSEPIDTSKLSPAATKEEIIAQLDGKVLGWGQWIGVWERT